MTKLTGEDTERNRCSGVFKGGGKVDEIFPAWMK